MPQDQFIPTDDDLMALWSEAQWRSLITQAMQIRAFELSMLDEFSHGGVRGTVHTCYGQEIVPAVVINSISANDFVFGTHRAHGYYLARTHDHLGLAAEIMGKAGGTSAGVGGSQHLHGEHFFTNGVQGGMVPIAVGAVIDDTENIAVAVIGDGTLATGVLYESMNIAALHSVGLVVIVEDNGIAQSTPQSQFLAGSVELRAAAFGLEYRFADSRDLPTTKAVIDEAVNRARGARTPQLVHVRSYRLGPHSKGDDNRSAESIDSLRQADVLNRVVALDDSAAEAWGEAQRAQAQRVAELRERAAADALMINHAPERVAALLESASGEADALTVDGTGRDLAAARVTHSLDAHSDAVLIGEDIETLAPGMTRSYSGAFGVVRGLSETYNGRVRNMPIAEASIVGVAIGRALVGKPTVAEIMFGDFSTLMVDQVRQQASKIPSMYGRFVPLPVLFRLPTGGRRGYGPTHSQNLDAMFVGIPNTIVYSVNEWAKQLDAYSALLETGLPTIALEPKDLYTKPLLGTVPAGYRAVAGSTSLGPTVITPAAAPARATIIAHGYAASLARDAAEQLALRHEVFVEVVVPAIISPLDPQPLIESLTRTGRLLVAEESVAAQGWSSTVLAALNEAGHIPLSVAVAGGVGDIGASLASESAALLSATSIVEAVMRMVKS